MIIEYEKEGEGQSAEAQKLSEVIFVKIGDLLHEFGSRYAGMESFGGENVRTLMDPLKELSFLLQAFGLFVNFLVKRLWPLISLVIPIFRSLRRLSRSHWLHRLARKSYTAVYAPSVHFRYQQSDCRLPVHQVRESSTHRAKTYWSNHFYQFEFQEQMQRILCKV